MKHLLIIDPQNDFCDLPADQIPARRMPALPVSGAHADMTRLSDFVSTRGQEFERISITLDSHNPYHISHANFWKCGDIDIAPFTEISAEDVAQRHITPRDDSLYESVLLYLTELEAQGRYKHMVWPEHCIVGTWGHNIHALAQSACAAWEMKHSRAVDYIFKGLNHLCECYSAVRPEVQTKNMRESILSINAPLPRDVYKAKELYIAGEAGSHCVRATVEHLLEDMPDHEGRRPDVILLTDCMSPVSGFEEPYKMFLSEMQNRGVKLMSASQT